MNGNDQKIEIAITADPAAAQAGINDVNAAVAELSGTLDASATAGDRAGSILAQAHAVAATKAIEHAEAESILGASIGKVEVATNAAARAFGALGISSGEATERILAVTEAVDALQASAGPLILLGGAFLAIGAAVNFVKEGIADAAREQAEFASMQVAVTNQGGKWDEARESVERFATTLQEATTFSRGEAIAAINDLTTAGISYADSEKLVAISTDVAAAKHMTLLQVTGLIKGAEAGRGQGLIRLDENLKKVIQSHGTLSDLARVLAHDFSGEAAEATTTLEGKEARLRNELELLGTSIGDRMLPFLEKATDFLIGMTKAAENATDAIGSLIRTDGDWVAIARDTVMNPGNLGNDFKGLGRDYKGAFDASKKTAYDVLHPLNAGEVDVEANRRLQSYRDQPFDHDAKLGRDQKAGAEKAPVAFDMIGDDSAPKTDAVVAAQKTLDQQLKATTASEDAFKLAIELATTSEGKAAAESALRSKVSADAAEASVRLGRQIAAERAEIETLTKEQTAASASARKFGEEHDSLASALDRTQDRSKTAAQRVGELKKEHDAAQKSSSELASKIVQLTADLSTNSDALARQPALYAANRIAENQYQLAYNDSRDASRQSLADQRATTNVSLEVQRDYWVQQIALLDKNTTEAEKKLAAYWQRYAELQNNFGKVNVDIDERDQKGGIDDALAQQKLADEEATYKKSLAQQLAYYEQRYALAVAAEGQYSDVARKYADQIRTIEYDEDKQRIDAADAFYAEMQTKEASLVDDILVKHRSMRDELKSIWADMLTNWEKSLEEMILKSTVLKGLNNLFAGATGGGTGGGTGGSAGGGGFLSMLGLGGATASGGASASATGAAAGSSQYGAFGALFGAQGAQSVISGLPTQDGVTGLLVGSQTTQEVASAASGAGGGSSIPGYGQDTTAGSIAAGPGGQFQSASGTGSIGGGSGGSALTQGLGNTIAGIGYGETANSLLGGNQTWGTVGAIAGASVGAAFGGPVGADIGGALGGALGGLFGNKVTAYQNPDIKDTQRYGTVIADLLGKAGANGSTFYEDSSTKSLFGGQTALAGVEELLAGGQSAFTTATGLSATQYQAALAAYGASSTGSGKLNFDTNIGSEYVTGATGGGATTRYTQFGSLLTEIEQGLNNNGGSSAIPTFSLQRTFANPNLTTLDSTGTYLETAANATNLLGASGAGKATVTVNLQGAQIVGPGGLAGVAQTISKALGQLNTGQLPGGYGAGQNLRRFTGGS